MKCNTAPKNEMILKGLGNILKPKGEQKANCQLLFCEPNSRSTFTFSGFFGLHRPPHSPPILGRIYDNSNTAKSQIPLAKYASFPQLKHERISAGLSVV